MKSVEKPVVSKVQLVSNLDYTRPLDRLDDPVEITSQLNYIEPENSTAEVGAFRDASRLVFQEMGRPGDFAGVVLSNDDPHRK